MANWTNFKDWLGLGDNYDAGDSDYDYDDYDDYDDDAPSTRGMESAYDRPAVRAVPSQSSQPQRPRPERARPADDWDEGDGGVRVITSVAEPEEPRGIVRPLPTAAKPIVISPRAFNDAPELADHFKANRAVVIKGTSTDRDVFRRLVDFCSGYCYLLDGKMERVADQVFLIIPPGVTVADGDLKKIRDGEIDD
ncbi:MAG: cell division protein SepF [Microthrixaceae bacterium]